MKPLKASESFRRKSVPNKSIKKLKDYFQCRGVKHIENQCQAPTVKSSDKNLMSVFRIMWNTNMLLKNVLNKNGAVTENNFKGSLDVKSTIENVYKIIWKSNTLINYELNLHRST